MILLVYELQWIVASSWKHTRYLCLFLTHSLPVENTDPKSYPAAGTLMVKDWQVRGKIIANYISLSLIPYQSNTDPKSCPAASTLMILLLVCELLLIGKSIGT